MSLRNCAAEKSASSYLGSSTGEKSACRADLMYCCLKNAAAVSAHAVKLILLVICNHYLCEN
jgi:hypothetical protein